MSHLTEIPTPPDSAVHQALAVLRDERDMANALTARYSSALMAIEARASGEQAGFKHDKDAFIAFGLIANIAHRALQLDCLRLRRTWRDRIAAWWATQRAR